MNSTSIHKILFPSCLWHYPKADGNFIYLTFDDGPIPELTPFVLDTLKQYGVHATFFCVGENVQRQPQLFQRIKDEGHVVANHSYNHLNGWKSNTRQYIKNVLLAERKTNSKLFRPPYGKISRSQLQCLLQKGYRIVMWDVLTKDYDSSISEKECLQRSLTAKAGSIVVFHDNIKAEKNLRYSLPQFIEHYLNAGFEFKTLSN